MAASALCMSKRTLENTTMHVYRVRESRMVRVTRVEVELSLQKMKNDTDYLTVVGPDNWMLEVVRDKKDVTLKLFTTVPLAGTHQDLTCSVKYDDVSKSEGVVVRKSAWNTYVVTLPAKMISHPATTFSRSGSRRGAICVLDAITSTIAPRIIPHAGARLFEEGQLPSLMFSDERNMLRDESDEQGLLERLIHKSARFLFTDFNLRGLEGSVVGAHKSVLAVRSGIFRDLLRENAEVESADVDYPEDLLHQASYFMHYSEIVDPSSRLLCLLQGLSENLAIGSLKELCMNYFKRYDSAV